MVLYATRRSGFLVGVGLFSIAWAMPALAQSVAASPAPASPQADNDSQIADIIVTAQKRSQNLQDVPLAVSAISADAMAAKGIADTTDLMGSMPSLQVTTPYGKTQPNFSLRGISVANEFTATTASPVGVYVDEVYQSFRASHGGQLYDLDRVEVLRGPQGTLYGRNTTGGAISFYTNRPSLDKASGSITVGYANYDTWSGQGFINVPLVTDTLGIRIAGSAAKGDGWQYNPTQNRYVGTTNSVAGRFSLRWKPSSNLDINFKVYGSRDNPLAPNAYGIGQLAGQTNAMGYSRVDASGRPTIGRNAVASDTGGHYFSSTVGGSLNIAWDINSNLSLTSITGYDYSTYRNSPFDCDGSPYDICAIRYYSNSKNFNQDLRLAYKSDKLNLVVGAYYGIDKIYTHNQPDFFGVLNQVLPAGVPTNPAIATSDSIRVLPMFAVNPALTPADPGFCAPYTGPGTNPNGFLDARSLLGFLTDISLNNTTNGGTGGSYFNGCLAAGALPFTPILADQYYNIRRPSKAIYADATFDLTDKLSLTGGLRYTWDVVEYYNGRTILRDAAGNAFASTIPYTFPYDASAPAMRQREAANRLTGRFNVSYKFDRDIMAYAQYSRGYRSGSFNGLAYQGTNQVYYIQPEQVNAYEGGIKTRLFDRRVQLNMAGFYYDYKNQQFTQVIGATTFTRSGNGRLYGGEAELNVQAARTLRFDATLGLLNTKYTGNVMDPTNPSSATMSINGNPFPNAPKMTFSAGFDWSIIDNGPGGGQLTLRGDSSYMGKYYFDPFKNYGQNPCGSPVSGSNTLLAGPAIACGNPSYWLFNGRLTYKTDNWSASIWGKNLTNKYYYTYGLNINIFNLDYLNRGTPRTYGIELTARF